MKNEGILFDLDGTLWEVIDVTLESANYIAQKYGLKVLTKQTICSVFGLNKIESSQLYFPYLELKDSLKLMDEIEEYKNKKLKKYGGNIYPNIKEVLTELEKDYQLFIVSNTAKSEYIEAFLSSAKLEKYFTHYIAASELNISKADAINKIIKEHKLKKAVYVGDTKKDLEASNIANIPFIQAKYGFGEDLNTQNCINELRELPGVIKKIL